MSRCVPLAVLILLAVPAERAGADVIPFLPRAVGIALPDVSDDPLAETDPGVSLLYVIRPPHAAIVALARDLATDLDPYMLADSVIGLLLFNSSTALLRRHLAGRTTPPESPGDIARHVMALLTRAFAPQDSP